jgi:hypothetical protein
MDVKKNVKNSFGFAIYNVLVYNNSMTHKDIITIAKFKAMGFTNVEMKYISEIKLNRIACDLKMKVGKGTYTIPFESYCNIEPKIVLSRHSLFQSVLLQLEEFNAKEYKEKIAHLEKIGVK